MTEKIKYKIFIIEDEALVARELKSRLTNMGYDVVGIAYGRGGIRLALETRPDLLLTDIHLKDGEDGIELAQSIQRDLDVPVVFLTAYSDEDTVARAKAVTPYGYIIKPVENRELQITIEMALYKFNIERELRETQQLLQTALTCIGSALVFVNHGGAIADLNSDAERLFHVKRNSVIGQPWLDIFSLDGDASVGKKISLALQSHEVTKLAPFIISSGNHLPNLVDGIVGPMESGGVMILRELSKIHDPVEMLARPEELMANLGADRLAPSESTMCQLLIAVDTAGGSPDAIVMASVSSKLNQMLRATDLVSRFGDSQLSVSMPYTATVEGQQIAQSILRALKQLDGSAGKLVFSIGMSSTTSGDQQPFELFRRASWALNVARESGGSRVISWSDKSEQPVAALGQEERQREYHNVVLLWNVMNIVVKSSDEETLGDKLTLHLLHSFDFDKVALLESRVDSIASIAGAIKGQAEFHGVGDLSLTEEDFGRTHKLLADASAFARYRDRYLFALAGNKILYIESAEQLASTEVEFLQTLVSYFAARFISEDKTIESPDMPESELVYRSPRMESIMESVNLVAPTDATVLIVGESGTGKERLARAIHKASKRSNQPFVIVDCGAVVGSLIESELFGHVKGAFTGADRNFSGRLKEAQGGTVLLDEVGELPLDVQVKLLRFVQEHQVAAVGSNKYETVDTRVIAATNRDLATLIREGKFREDLYYRLNVFSIETPPLREREGDVLVLARHYLDHYAHQYNKAISGFTSEAERALLQQPWPGNIRELMNVINRSVILCRDSKVSSIHLGLFPDASSESARDEVDEVDTLESWLSQLVDKSLSSGDLPPLAQWLEEDLILTTLAINADVLNRAATSLGIPETTLRRKVARLRETSAVHDRPRHSEAIARMINQLIEFARLQRQPVLDVVSNALLRELEARRLNKRDAAALMGVSLPTYRKMISEAP